MGLLAGIGGGPVRAARRRPDPAARGAPRGGRGRADLRGRRLPPAVARRRPGRARRPGARRGAPADADAAAGARVRSSSLPRPRSSPPRSCRASGPSTAAQGPASTQGAVMLAVLVACRGGRGASAVGAAGARPRATAVPGRGRRVARVGLGAVVAATLALFVLSAAQHHDVVVNARQGATNQRLTSIESNRGDFWRVARHAFAEPPAGRRRLGRLPDRVAARRTIPYAARDAHSLYFETAAELGARRTPAPDRVARRHRALRPAGLAPRPSAGRGADRRRGHVGRPRGARLGLGDARRHALRARPRRGRSWRSATGGSVAPVVRAPPRPASRAPARGRRGRGPVSGRYRRARRPRRSSPPPSWWSPRCSCASSRCGRTASGRWPRRPEDAASAVRSRRRSDLQRARRFSADPTARLDEAELLLQVGVPRPRARPARARSCGTTPARSAAGRSSPRRPSATDPRRTPSPRRLLDLLRAPPAPVGGHAVAAHARWPAS